MTTNTDKIVRGETSGTFTEIEYMSGVIDKLGRCSFFLNWRETNGKIRSQIFFADPKDYGHDRPNKELT